MVEAFVGALLTCSFSAIRGPVVLFSVGALAPTASTCSSVLRRGQGQVSIDLSPATTHYWLFCCHLRRLTLPRSKMGKWLSVIIFLSNRVLQ